MYKGHSIIGLGSNLPATINNTLHIHYNNPYYDTYVPSFDY